MIASLMMYARAEHADADARYWASIRVALADRGIAAPARLSNDADAFAVWTAPHLVLSQTCGLPYRTRLKDRVALVGTPDFGVEGCAAGAYRSAIVVRADDPRDTLQAFRDARLAFNQRESQSGFAAIHAEARAEGFWFDHKIETGGHALSARAVAQGQADLAAIDAVTWRFLQRYDPVAADLRVLGWTAPTPGLPYISALDADVAAIRAAVTEAMAALTPADCDTLGLRGLVQIPRSDYLAVPTPPADA